MSILLTILLIILFGWLIFKTTTCFVRLLLLALLLSAIGFLFHLFIILL